MGESDVSARCNEWGEGLNVDTERLVAVPVAAMGRMVVFLSEPVSAQHHIMQSNDWPAPAHAAWGRSVEDA